MVQGPQYLTRYVVLDGVVKVLKRRVAKRPQTGVVSLLAEKIVLVANHVVEVFALVGPDEVLLEVLNCEGGKHHRKGGVAECNDLNVVQCKARCHACLMYSAQRK